MVIHMIHGSVTLLPDPDGVAYQVVRHVAEWVDDDVVLPWGLVASGVAPRVSDVENLVWLLFGERWAVN